MLTRLTVSGFKNLVDADVRFGPFTCIAGTNGVGKSNLFDAIRFLSNLATHPLREAALMVRDGQSKSGDLRSLFTRTGDEYGDTMSLAAEMIISRHGEDDLGQLATARTTFLRYEIELAYEAESEINTLSRLVIRRELLTYINRGEAAKRLGFPHKKEWRDSVILGRRTVDFISTEPSDSGRIIRRHQELGGIPQSYVANKLTRTVLSSVNAEAATAALVKREMQSWRLFHLEPRALRQADSVDTFPRISSDGEHLPATLYHLARTQGNSIYARISNRLAELNEDVQGVVMDRDSRTDILTIEIRDSSNTLYSAKDLSDGTLRVLALAILEEDDKHSELLCLEEPENGIHPARIESILNLLLDIATDTDVAMEEDTSIRQIIINTHSPVVINSLPIDTLIFAERAKLLTKDGRLTNTVRFAALPDTWRTTVPVNSTDSLRPASTITLGKILAYLNVSIKENETSESSSPTVPFRLRDQFNLQMELFTEAATNL